MAQTVHGDLCVSGAVIPRESLNNHVDRRVISSPLSFASSALVQWVHEQSDHESRDGGIAWVPQRDSLSPTRIELLPLLNALSACSKD